MRMFTPAFVGCWALSTAVGCVTVQRPVLSAGESPAPSLKDMRKQLCASLNKPDAVDRLQEFAEAWEQQEAASEIGPREGLGCNLPAPLSDYLEAATLARQARFRQSAAVLERAQENAMPQGWRAAIALRQAWVALHLQDVTSARQYLDQAQAADPTRVDVNLVYARALMADHAYAAAVERLRAILDQQPGLRDIERAHALLAQVVREAEPPLSVQAQQMAQALMQAAEQADAQATQASPDAAGGPELRKELLRHAMAVADAAPHPRVHTLAGLIALRVGDAPRGLRLLDAALAANRLDPDPSRILAGFYLARNEPWAAMQHLKVASASDPFDVELQHVMVPVALRLGDVKTALAGLQRLQVLQPHDPANLGSLKDTERVWRDMQAVSATPL